MVRAMAEPSASSPDPHPAYPAVYAVRPPVHPLAVVSLVVSIIGVLVSALPWVGIVLGAAGAVCGHLALAKIAASPIPRSGRGLAIAGLVVGYVAAAVGAIATWLLWYVASAFSDAFSS